MEIVSNICHSDILQRTFFDVINSLCDVKILIGFHGGVGSMKFFLQQGNDPVKTALDIGLTGRRQLWMSHHFKNSFLIWKNRIQLLDRSFPGKMAVFAKRWSVFPVETDPDISPGIRRFRFVERAGHRRNEKALSGFQGIFPVVHIEISLSAQHKMDGVISPDTRAVGLFRCTFFPAAGNKMKFF